MREVRIGPSKIYGVCPAGHQIGDVQRIEGTEIHSEAGPICYVAVGALTAQVTQIQWQRRISSHLSCPGCGSDPEDLNRVVFVLSWADVWPAIWTLSQYNWERKAGRETEESRQISKKAWELAGSGRSEEAEEKAREALAEIRG